MTAAAWSDQLAELTGEELYHLLGATVQAMQNTVVTMAMQNIGDPDHAGLLGMYNDQCELFADASIQLARFTCPIREASAIVWRARYARRHPVVIASG